MLLETDICGSSSVCCVQFNPTDAGQLVSGSEDYTVKLLSVDDGGCQQAQGAQACG